VFFAGLMKTDMNQFGSYSEPVKIFFYNELSQPHGLSASREADNRVFFYIFDFFSLSLAAQKTYHEQPYSYYLLER